MTEENSAYKQAGVDIDAGELTVRNIKERVRATFNDKVLTELGGFGGMYLADFQGMTAPVLVSSIDGVGTKVKVAAMMNKYDTIGADLVNHCINDVLMQGASPLFFLDYFATSHLEPAVVEEVVGGMALACSATGCALIGGETAEMPGVYVEGEFDLAGCIIGVVDREKVIDSRKVAPGDVIIGLASSGLHTNGFSLARKVLFEDAGLKADQYMPELGGVLGEVLLAPHRCYLKPVVELMRKVEVHSMAHITGGGFYGNISRILPTDCQAIVERGNWVVPPIFHLIQDKGGISGGEMHRAFNMGIGMVVIVAKENGIDAMNILEAAGETARLIGEVRQGSREVVVI